MRKRVRRRQEAYVRAQNVCAEHSDWFDATPGGQKARAALNTHVAEVDRLFALQERTIEDRRAATEKCRQSRHALRAAAKAVVAVGRVVHLDVAVMGKMRLPSGATDEELLAYSRALLDRVSPYADAFVADGLPPDLLKHLGDGIAEFAAARDTQAASRQRFTVASDAIHDELDEAAQAIDVLEGIVDNTPDAPSDVLTRLRIARRVGPRITPVPKAPPSTPSDKAA